MLTACNGNHETSKKENTPRMTIEQVQEKYSDQWMALEGVVGTGIGEFKGKPCIKIFVTKKSKELMKKIPATVEGFPVILEVTGEFKAVDDK